MSGAGHERFLRAIAERLPSRRIVDIRLFAPLKQGGIESGVAIITAALDVAPDMPARFTIYRAQYRLTIKGAERGKWDVSVTEEADVLDAPRRQPLRDRAQEALASAAAHLGALLRASSSRST